MLNLNLSKNGICIGFHNDGRTHNMKIFIIQIRLGQMSKFFFIVSVISTHRYIPTIKILPQFHDIFIFISSNIFTLVFGLVASINLVCNHQQNYIVAHMRALATWHWTWNKMRRTRHKFLSFSNTIGCEAVMGSSTFRTCSKLKHYCSPTHSPITWSTGQTQFQWLHSSAQVVEREFDYYFW